jgi:adenine-specific DNA-methyltransferase
VVVNFLNRKNEADKRVFELLEKKFQLFEGVFGSSDEILGSIESGVDFEKRIAAIYNHCRRPDEIQEAFDQLQLELSYEINESMTRTRQQLLENFDDVVREKLRISAEDSKASLSRYEQFLMQLTRHELNGNATFTSDAAFQLTSLPPALERADIQEIDLGPYKLPRRPGEAHLYRLNHPLAEALVARAKDRLLMPAEVHFTYGDHEGKVSDLLPLIGQSGWLTLSSFSIESLDQSEDHLIFTAATDAGNSLDQDAAARLLTLPGQVINLLSDITVPGALEAATQKRQADIQRRISERNAQFFEAEAEKLDGWADDLKAGLEREIREFDRQIREARRAAATAMTLEEKLSGQRQIKALEGQRNQKRRSLFEAQDQVDAQRETLIGQIERKLKQKTSIQQLFTLRWVLLQ